jgi:hypothetical protein
MAAPMTSECPAVGTEPVSFALIRTWVDAQDPDATTADLATIDLAVSDLGYDFLRGRTALTRVNFILSQARAPPPLLPVTILYEGFLRDCAALTSVDLSGFVNVTAISRDFLRDSVSLTSLDLGAGLARVTDIPAGFLCGCTALKSVDLTGFANVTRIGDSFIADCLSLTSIDLTPLGKLRVAGHHFLRRCPADVNFAPVAHAFATRDTAMKNDGWYAQ